MHEAIPAHTTHQHQGKCQVFPPPNPLLSNLPAGCGNFQKGKRWLCLVFPLFGCLHTGRETVMKELLQSSHNLATQSTSHTRLETDLTAELQRKQGLVWKRPQAKLFELVSPTPAPCPLSGWDSSVPAAPWSYQTDFCKANATLRGRKQHRSLEKMFFQHPVPPEPSSTSWH